MLEIDHWTPAEPQFCKGIAAHYGQSKRTIQKWFVDLREIAPWFSEAELRLSDDRYSPLAVELLVESRNSSQSSNPVQTSIPANAPADSVPVLTTQKLTTLDRLAEKTGEMVPYRRSAVTLNGTQDEALDAIVLITERLE